MKEFDFSLFTDPQLGELARQGMLEYSKRREEAKRLRKERGGLVEGSGACVPEPREFGRDLVGEGAAAGLGEGGAGGRQVTGGLEVFRRSSGEQAASARVREGLSAGRGPIQLVHQTRENSPANAAPSAARSALV